MKISFKSSVFPDFNKESGRNKRAAEEFQTGRSFFADFFCG